MIDTRERGPIGIYKKEQGPQRKRGARRELTQEAVFAAGDEEGDGSISNEPVDWKTVNPNRLKQTEQARGRSVNQELDDAGLVAREGAESDIDMTGYQQIVEREMSLHSQSDPRLPELTVVEGGANITEPVYDVSRLKGQEPDAALLLARLEDRINEGESLSDAEKVQLKRLQAEKRGGKDVARREMWDKRARVYGVVSPELQGLMRENAPGFMLVISKDAGNQGRAGGIIVERNPVGIKVVAVYDVAGINAGDIVPENISDDRFKLIQNAALRYSANSADLRYEVSFPVQQIVQAAQRKAEKKARPNRLKKVDTTAAK